MLRSALVLVSLFLFGPTTAQAPAPDRRAPAATAGLIHVLILDGQNNHDWVSTTACLRATLAATGRFRVDTSMSPGKKATRADWDRWKPAFANADVVVVNYNGLLWPEHVRQAFETWVREGGGVVFVHAANNAIMRGIPASWMHGKDELYDGQRGPAKNMTVLSSAFSAENRRGTSAHEPITWVIPFGKGRCVTTVMGHHMRRQKDFDALRCVGFQTVFARSVEWAATKRVTIPAPDNFPTAEQTSIKAPR